LSKSRSEEAAAAPLNTSGTQTLDRGLDLLEHTVREPMRLAELVRRTGLSRSTTARLAARLVERGLLSVDGGGRYRPGFKLMQLGALANGATDVVSVARPYLEELTDATGFSTFVGRREGDFSVHLHCVPGSQRIMVSVPVGTQRHVSETSLGKALILDDGEAAWKRLSAEADIVSRSGDWPAEMKACAERGVVIHTGPPPDLIRAIGAPVRDSSGRIQAAISLVSVAQYIDDEKASELASQVRETAHRISRAMGCETPGATR
jgi:DNA-binding IclR family transcriptional regulator